MITCNCAQYYGISQSDVDELCHKYRVYPIPDYERFFTNIYGDLFVINISKGLEMIIQPSLTIDNETNIKTYLIYDMNDNPVNITNVQLCALTFYGYFPFKYIYLKNDYFEDSSSLRYKIESYDVIGNDTILVNGIMFKRIYYDGTIWTYNFISNKGVAFNDLKKKIYPHAFQHNMYHRHPIAVNHKQMRIGTHRLVFNTWSNKWTPSDKPINHIDGFKYHNFIDNLEETTHLENFRHAQITGLRVMPYSSDFIHKLCSLLETGKYKPKEMQCIMGVPDEKYSAFRNLVKSIVSRNAWQDISKYYNIEKYKLTRHDGISDEIIESICNDYVNNNYALGDIYNKYQNIASKSALAAICRGSSHKDITSKYDLSPKRTHISRECGRNIRSMIAIGYSDDEIAQDLTVLPETVKLIRQKESYKQNKGV